MVGYLFGYINLRYANCAYREHPLKKVRKYIYSANSERGIEKFGERDKGSVPWNST